MKSIKFRFKLVLLVLVILLATAVSVFAVRSQLGTPVPESSSTAALVAAPSAAGSGIITEALPENLWVDDSAEGYHGFTTRAQLGAKDSIGVLEIESIDLSVNAYDSGDDMADMKKGIAHFQSTSYWDGNIGFAGHNGSANYSYFGKLHKVQKGDLITYTTELGSRTYTVTDIWTISDEDWSHLERTEDNRLTLITCVSDPSKRLCVQAVEK